MATCVVCKEPIPDTPPDDEPSTFEVMPRGEIRLLYHDVRSWICRACVHAIARLDGMLGTEPALQFIDLEGGNADGA